MARLGMSVCAVCAAAGAGVASGQVVDFDGVAFVNVNPVDTYVEIGFEFTPVNGSSAVFDDQSVFPGSSSGGFLGFAPGNTITVDRVDGASFDFDSALVGPSTLGFPPIEMTFNGFFTDGTTDSVTFSNLQSATQVQIGWFGLDSFTIETTSDGAIDNVSFVPTPGVLAAFGAAGLVGLRRRR